MNNKHNDICLWKTAVGHLRLLAICIMVVCSYALMAQENTNAQSTEVDSTKNIISYIKHVMSFNRTVPQEKVYMHFDNTGYFEGETIWFKAYVIRTDNGMPTDLSRVLYVELLNPSGDVLKTGKYYIDQKGQARGDMLIDSLYTTGFYEVRAYTRYMTNWGTNAVFSRVFPVFKKPKVEGDYKDLTLGTRLYQDRNPNNRDQNDSLYMMALKEGVYTDELAKTISVQFYPEGGNLVVGKKCRVALLAVTDNGRPYQGEGSIVNKQGEVVATVLTDTLGRGLFEMVPDGNTLQMKMDNMKGKTQRFDLPVAIKEGCVLTLDAVSDQMLATIQCSDALCNRVLGYAVMHNGNLVYCDTVIAQPLIEVELDRSMQKEGVSQFTVFDQHGRVLAERLFFICPKPSASDSITFTSEASRLKPCGKVTLDVQAQPNTTFSFSAIDVGSMNNGKQGNLKTWMLLSSEVRGYIDHVDYYFEADDPVHRKAADMLMLTQGWRRYDWNVMSGVESMGKLQPVEDKFYVFGKLNVYRKHNPASFVDIQAILYNQAGQNLKGNAKTDADGNYAFELPFLDGEWKMYFYTTINDKKKTFRVGIDRQISPKPRYITPVEASVHQLNPPNMFVRDIHDSIPEEEVFVPITQKDFVLQNVTVKAKKRYFTSSTDNLRFKNENYGRKWAALYYDIDRERENIRDEGVPEPDIFELLAMKNTLFKDYGFHVGYNGAGNPCLHKMTYNNQPIRWIVDNDDTQSIGATTSATSASGDEFFPVDLDEIKSVYIAPYDPDYDTQAAAKGGDTSNCVKVYLYTHKRFTTASNKGIRRTYFQGFDLISTFQMEDYSVIPPMADFRRTIYWNPDVTTDAEGKAKVEFFNNSTCEEMYISAEGMTNDGKMVVKE